MPKGGKTTRLEYNTPVARFPAQWTDQTCLESSNLTKCFPFISAGARLRTESWQEHQFLPLCLLHVPSQRLVWDLWMWVCASGWEEKWLWGTVLKNILNLTWSTALRVDIGVEAPNRGSRCKIITEHNQSEPLPIEKLYMTPTHCETKSPSKKSCYTLKFNERNRLWTITQVFQRQNLRHSHTIKSAL